MQFIPADASPPEDALLLDNTQDVLARADEVGQATCVMLQFPKWTDGRAYSQAVLLRSRLRYGGQVRATGENSTTVWLLDAQGQPEASATAQRIVQVLADDLK